MIYNPGIATSLTLPCHIQENLQNIHSEAVRRDSSAVSPTVMLCGQACGQLGAFSVCHGYRSGTQANASHLFGQCNTDLFQRAICVINTDRHFVSCPYLSACQFAFVLSNNHFFFYKIVISFQVNSCSTCNFSPQTRESQWSECHLT